jgi:hypothetical protein
VKASSWSCIDKLTFAEGGKVFFEQRKKTPNMVVSLSEKDRKSGTYAK